MKTNEKLSVLQYWPNFILLPLYGALDPRSWVTKQCAAPVGFSVVKLCLHLLDGQLK